ncbi:hypothetical protein PR003_g9840 [Phytophthora rubi]|uniref:RxLR effector protein n=1 Tax=Phytophthora rubi TaxID=129364 RepID=A0A6A3LDT1_9STRA|nr:hypothetical protein PF003_g35722 [Phytophthora fragariae]KAE9016192.1 hypothetical protein PR002_g13721 [Phytophthora rubi]KAE9017582.1 hypothetical protein PR001_g14359 [Phytophthora rubi]KAE9341714.1 hypothetical protein PR003_g9840 [Phytophthora rubi]
MRCCVCLCVCVCACVAVAGVQVKSSRTKAELGLVSRAVLLLVNTGHFNMLVT